MGAKTALLARPSERKWRCFSSSGFIGWNTNSSMWSMTEMPSFFPLAHRSPLHTYSRGCLATCRGVWEEARSKRLLLPPRWGDAASRSQRDTSAVSEERDINYSHCRLLTTLLTRQYGISSWWLNQKACTHTRHVYCEQKAILKYLLYCFR